MSVIKARAMSNVFTLASNKTTTGDTDTLWSQIPNGLPKMCIQIWVSSTSGNVSGSVQPQVSNDGIHWADFDNLIEIRNLAPNSSVIEILAHHNFAYTKFVVKTLEGTGAAINLLVAV